VWRVVASALAAMWNLYTTQPNYFAPTYSEIVNLTGLLKTKDETYGVEKYVCLR
jgi:hypothetical protein